MSTDGRCRARTCCSAEGEGGAPLSLRIRREDVDALVAPLTHDQDQHPMTKTTMMVATEDFTAVVDGVREEIVAGADRAVADHELVRLRPECWAPESAPAVRPSGSVKAKAPPKPGRHGGQAPTAQRRRAVAARAAARPS